MAWVPPHREKIGQNWDFRRGVLTTVNKANNLIAILLHSIDGKTKRFTLPTKMQRKPIEPFFLCN